MPIRLCDALLCVNCDSISSGPSCCESCGSVALLSLARVLNPIVDERPRFHEAIARVRLKFTPMEQVNGIVERVLRKSGIA